MFKELPVKLTLAAIAEIKDTFERKKIPAEYALRIGMKGSGCSGTTFIIGFDTQKEQDEIFELEGFKIYIEKKHLLYLFDIQVDFIANETERGFVFL